MSDILAPADFSDRKLHLFTADKVGNTGTITFTYMGKAGDAARNAAVPHPWGWIWQSHGRKNELTYNFFQNGGLVAGGGFSDLDEPWWRQDCLQTMPQQASALISTADFEWLVKNVLEPAKYPYERHHIDHDVFTS